MQSEIVFESEIRSLRMRKLDILPDMLKTEKRG